MLFIKRRSIVCNALLSALFVMTAGEITAQSVSPDSAFISVPSNNKSEDFYDSLKVRASRKNFYKLIYDALVTGHKPVKDIKSEAISYYSQGQGKTIRKIQFLRLDVFGPSLQDTARKARSSLEKIGNSIHTRSDLNNLRKNLIIKPGDQLNAETLYENERIFRTMPRIRDARFVLIPDSLNPEAIDLLLITQDRFSIGVSGVVEGSNSAKGQIYNRNFFGLGHEVSLSLVGHLTRQPYLGLESYYRINNIDGRFLSFSAGYYNTYRNEGASVLFEKPLIRTSDKWAYGIEAFTYARTDELPELIREFRDASLRYNQFNLWGARNFQLGRKETPHSQLTLSLHYFDRNFKNRPLPFEGEDQFFADSRALFAGFTWSQRFYNPDLLIYGYGITEDIPKGFKNEMVVGYDQNENGDRVYGHLLVSNGNFLRNHPGYLYVYGGISGFYSNRNFHQGLLEAGLNWISGLKGNGGARFRNFLRLDYMQGIHRFQAENLAFRKNDLIRGFDSRQLSGKQRLNLNLESVYFQRKEFYRFNIAIFTFVDLGILGQENRMIFKEKYYYGFGAGMRLHNESLVLKTILIRMGVYPNHPADVGLLGLLITEQTRQRFYDFQPGPPSPRRFE